MYLKHKFMIAECPLYKEKDLSLNPQDSYKGSVLVQVCTPSTRVVRRHADPQAPGMHLARVAKSESSRFIESSHLNRRKRMRLIEQGMTHLYT